MSNIDPDLFRPTASEALANMAKDRLEAMGGNMDHLKSAIDKALQPKKDTPSIGNQLEKGLF